MKITRLLILSITAFTLSACDFLGGNGDGENDVKLYSLTLTTNLDKAKSSIRAELSRARDQDEIDALLDAGATQEDIDKSNTCVNGKYYFFNQDPIHLFEPFLPGYEFLGWYSGNDWLGYLDTDYDGNPDYIWNMDDSDITLEARFKLVNYSILYMDENTNPASYKSNPTLWNVEQGEITLGHEDKELQGLKFDGWTFAMGGGAFYEGYVTKLNEQFLIDSKAAKVSSNGTGELQFSLHENYSVIQDSFKLTYNENEVDNVYILVKKPGENTFVDLLNSQHFITGGEVETSLPRGTEVKVHAVATDWENTIVSGIFKNGQLVSTALSNDEYSFLTDGNAEYEIRIAQI